MFVSGELCGREIAIVDGIDEVIEHLGERALRNAYELRERLVFVSGEAFRDVSRRRPRRVTELISKLEIMTELRFCE
jgi:hypothetical protein